MTTITKARIIGICLSGGSTNGPHTDIEVLETDPPTTPLPRIIEVPFGVVSAQKP